MSRLTCPHCGGAVIANPIARWFSKFQCPHCHKPLRFDTKTNALGAAGAACFLATGGAYVNASDAAAMPIASALLAGCVVMVGLSYALRGIAKG